MDELERYLARRRRRQKFVIAVRDPAEPGRWARLQFDDRATLPRPGRIEDGLPRHLWLTLRGSGLVDFEDGMAGAGWTKVGPGYSDERGQTYAFERRLPPDDRPATLAAIARGAAALLLGTDPYLLTIEPFQGEAGRIGEEAGLGMIITIGGFVVGAVIAMLVALVVGDPVEVALVAGALVAIAALYLARPYLLDDAIARSLRALGESAVVELPLVGPVLENVLLVAVALVGLWVPIAVAIVITSAA